MPLPLAKLLETRDATYWRTAILDELQSRGLPVAAYVPGHVYRAIIDHHAKACADRWVQAQVIARQGLVELAAGDLLTLTARTRYGLTRRPAVRAQGTVVLTAASTAGPYTIVASRLWVATSAGVYFRGVSGGTLQKGGSLSVTVECREAGTVGNAQEGSITHLVSALPGVTVSNPSSSWRTTEGAAEESDAELRVRCRQRWATLGRGGLPADGWAYYAKAASPAVRKVHVISNRSSEGSTVAGLVGVVIAGESRGLSASVVSSVQSYLAPLAALCSAVSVWSARERVLALQGEVQVRAAYLAEARAAAEDAIKALAAALPIGSRFGRTVLAVSSIIHAIESARADVDAVVAVTLTSPTSDLALEEGEVLHLDHTSLVWTGV